VGDTSDPTYVRLCRPGKHGHVLFTDKLPDRQTKTIHKKEECQTVVLGENRRHTASPPPPPRYTHTCSACGACFLKSKDLKPAHLAAVTVMDKGHLGDGWTFCSLSLTISYISDFF
jgi:hypothetical protein